MLRRGDGDRPRRGERPPPLPLPLPLAPPPRRSRSRPDSNRHDADGGVLAHCKKSVSKVCAMASKPCLWINIPLSSRYHHGRDACCAFHSKHHRHLVDLRTQQKQNWRKHVSTLTSRRKRKFTDATHSRLEEERGAGMSQRTRRP